MLGAILHHFEADDESRVTDAPTAVGGDTREQGVTDTRADATVPETEQESSARDTDRVVDWDTLFDTLGNQRRRRVLRRLVDRSEPLVHGPLAESIARRECDRDVDRLESSERKRVYVALYQSHLPKLASVGAITYDKSRGVVDRGPQFDCFERYLPETEAAPTARDADDGWFASISERLN